MPPTRAADDADAIHANIVRLRRERAEVRREQGEREQAETAQAEANARLPGIVGAELVVESSYPVVKIPAGGGA
jgi:hypothetical protein